MFNFIAFLGIVLAVGHFTGFFKKFSGNEEKSAGQEIIVQNLTIDTSAETKSDAAEKLADRNVYFAGINDGPISKGVAIDLVNPKENEDIYLQYTVVDKATGEDVFQTSLIEADKFVSWVPSETLDTGKHELIFKEQPYYQVDQDTWLPLTSGSNTVVIEILD